MNYAEICIIKRDGKREDFSISKIKNAIGKAFSATGIQNEQQLIADVTMSVISQFTHRGGNSGLSRKGIDEGTPRSGQEVHHLPRMAEHGAGQENPDEARNGRHRRHRQERREPEQRQHEQPHACRTNDDICIGSHQRLHL